MNSAKIGKLSKSYLNIARKTGDHMDNITLQA